MNRMHRGISLATGGFIGLVALTRLILRLYNTYMLAEYTAWYLFMLLVPQLVDLTIAFALLRGRKDWLAGGALALGGLYVAALSPLLTWLVNISNDVFRVYYVFTPFVLIRCGFYVLGALECFLSTQARLGKFRLLLAVLPALCFLGILAVDITRYATLLGDALTLGYLVNLLRNSLPGLAVELLANTGIALSLVLSPHKSQNRI